MAFVRATSLSQGLSRRNICAGTMCLGSQLSQYIDRYNTTAADYKANDDSAPVTAKKEIKLLRLPQILVLHMCRFTYAARGLNKLHKSMQFPIKLK